MRVVGSVDLPRELLGLGVGSRVSFLIRAACLRVCRSSLDLGFRVALGVVFGTMFELGGFNASFPLFAGEVAAHRPVTCFSSVI